MTSQATPRVTLSPKESAAEHLRHIESFADYAQHFSSYRIAELAQIVEDARGLKAELKHIAFRARLAREALEAGAATATEEPARLTLDVDELDRVSAALELEYPDLEAGERFIRAARKLAQRQRDARLTTAAEL